jgi:hypothetical protein
VDKAAYLALCGGKGSLRVTELVLDVSDGDCGVRPGFEFIQVGCKAIGRRFGKSKGMRGFIQGKEKDFAFHRFT